jgi:hypothetical protein
MDSPDSSPVPHAERVNERVIERARAIDARRIFFILDFSLSWLVRSLATLAGEVAIFSL